MSAFASKNSLAALSQNMKNTNKEMQNALSSLVALKKRTEQILANNNENDSDVESIVILIQELMIGSKFILSEMMSLFSNLISSEIGYEKRFYMKWLNQCFCESYIYFCKKHDGKDMGGVWLQIKPKIEPFHNQILDGLISCIDEALKEIDTNYCNLELRNATSHFNNPQDEYDKMFMCNDEDKFAKGVSLFMSLCVRLSDICTIIAGIPSEAVTEREKLNASNGEIRNAEISFLDLVNEKLFVVIKDKKEIILGLDKTIDDCNKEICYCNNHIKLLITAKEYGLSHNFKLKSNDVICQLFSIRMAVAFMRADLSCAIKSYIYSKTNIERASNLRRINLIETAIVTQLYGYNNVGHELSMWKKLRDLDNNYSDDETIQVECQLKDITKEFDKNERNLNTHYREGKKLNIVERFDAYNGQNHVLILAHFMKLLQLCKIMNVYLLHAIERYINNIHSENKSKEEQFHDFFRKVNELLCNSASSSETKKQCKDMLDEAEQKFNDLLKRI